MVNLPLIVTLGLALVGQVDAAKEAGEACAGDDGCVGTYVAVTTAAPSTTEDPEAAACKACEAAAPCYTNAGCCSADGVRAWSGMCAGCVEEKNAAAVLQCATCFPSSACAATATTTAAPVTNSSNNSRMLLNEEVLMFDDDVFGETLFDDDVFGEALARKLEAHLKCQCDTTAVSTTVPAGMKAVEVERHVVEGKMGFDFSSSRRLEAVDEDFVALSRKLLTVDQVQPHIQVGLQQTVHNDTEVTKCDKQDATDVFHTTYQIPCATAAAAAAATTALGDVAKAGAAFDALKAAVTTSAAASSVTLAIKGPPTVLEAPQTTKKMVTIFTAVTVTANATTTAEIQASGACPPKAMGVLMGLAVLAAAAN